MGKLQRSTVSDVDSDLTLVSDGTKNDTSNSHHDDKDDKENEPPPADSVMADAPADTILESTENEPGSPKDTAPSEQTPPPSSQPPPVPPRPILPPDPAKQLKEEVEIGAQQDVTEVINNVLFQSQCAIKPTSLAQDGEQLDMVKE